MTDFKRLLGYLSTHKVNFAFAVLAMVVGGILETATGALLVPIFQQFLPDRAGSSKTLFNLQDYIPQTEWQSAWLAIAAMLLTFTVVGGIAEYFSSYLMAKIGQSAVLQMRAELYRHLLSQSTSFYQKHRTNFLVSRLVQSCAAIELAVSANMRDVLRESFMLVFFLGAAFYYNWRLMLGSMIIAPIIALLTAKFSKSLRKLAERTYEGNKLLTDTAQETLSNQTIIKAYRAEEREAGRFYRVAKLIADANLRSGQIAALSPPVITTIGVIAISILLYFGLREIKMDRMDAAQFFVFLTFLFRSYDPMRKISRQHNELVKAFAAARDVWDIMDADEQMPDGNVEITDLRNAITLENVSFSYQAADARSTLSNVTTKIERGKMIALVGESGGGKSTFVKLIQRLYDPHEGAILWDGNDLRDLKLSSLKKQVALVSQETVLFNDTVKYNISYGKPDATDEDITNAAKIAFADDFINELPEKYDTMVGERGAFLSGGQRQRVAIARAVLLNAPVLILDEATSALDSESENLVQKALENLMSGKTSIVIAHRLATIRKADTILVMDRGRIIESGNHDDLFAKNGIYRKLHDLQFEKDDA